MNSRSDSLPVQTTHSLQPGQTQGNAFYNILYYICLDTATKLLYIHVIFCCYRVIVKPFTYQQHTLNFTPSTCYPLHFRFFKSYSICHFMLKWFFHWLWEKQTNKPKPSTPVSDFFIA